MYIKSVTLKNFRNYSDQTVAFDNGLNVVVGQNASGKTNLLESIYCCGIGKSPRTQKYKELIKWGEDFTYIKIILSKLHRDYTVEFAVDGKDKKRVAVDGIPLTRISDLLGILNIVFFSPDEMKLIKESPQERRRFMDISLSQQSKIYYNSLIKYNTILAQRNKLLKETYNKESLRQMLYAWDIQLVEQGVYLMKKRYEFVKKIGEYAGKTHLELSSDKEVLRLEYESEIADGDLKEMKLIFAEKLNNAFEKDVKLQYTTVGIHRDDIAIKANDIDIRKFGSQGQQRTSVLSMKLAEIELFKNEMGENPVLLLDDVLSELDESRRNKLIELSCNLQTFITCTDFDMPVSHKTIKITDGTASE